MQDLIFESVKELTNKISAGERAIQAWPQRGLIDSKYYRYVEGPGRGGKQLEICCPHGLREPYRNEWIRFEARQSPTPSFEDIDEKIYSKLKPFQKDYVGLWLNLFEKFGSLKGKDLQSALEIYQEENPAVKCSYKTFKRNQKLYSKLGISGIVPEYGTNEGKSKIPDLYFEIFKGGYLSRSQRSHQDCYRDAYGAAQRDGYDMGNFPTSRTFDFRLRKEVSEEIIFMARYGEMEWRRKYKHHIIRDKSTITAGSIWVGDHRQADVEVINPETGKRFRPWITAWMDFKTGKWLQVFPHDDAPNSDHVFLSFYWGLEEYGRPDTVIIDNGKDYRCWDFSGGRKNKTHRLKINENRARARLTVIGVHAHFALPYEPQAKNIEPAFKGFIDFEKTLKGYIGNDPKKRPAAAKSEELLTMDEFCAKYAEFQNILDNRPSIGREHKGLSSNQLFSKEFTQKKVLRPGAMREFLLRFSAKKTIDKAGVYLGDLDITFWSNEMIGIKGTEVYVAVDPRNCNTAWIYDLQERPLFEAHRVAYINGMETNDEGYRELKRQKSITNHESKELKRQIAEHIKYASTPDEYLERQKAANEAEKQKQIKKGTWVENEPKPKLILPLDTPADEIAAQKEQVLKEKEEREKIANTGLDHVAPPAPKKSQLKNWYDD